MSIWIVKTFCKQRTSQFDNDDEGRAKINAKFQPEQCVAFNASTLSGWHLNVFFFAFPPLSLSLCVCFCFIFRLLSPEFLEAHVSLLIHEISDLVHGRRYGMKNAFWHLRIAKINDLALILDLWERHKHKTESFHCAQATEMCYSYAQISL